MCFGCGVVVDFVPIDIFDNLFQRRCAAALFKLFTLKLADMLLSEEKDKVEQNVADLRSCRYMATEVADSFQKENPRHYKVGREATAAISSMTVAT